jgi:hypothetical protein
MLPPFIIEQIRKREEERQSREERPVLELPLDNPHDYAPPAGPGAALEQDQEPKRGVVIVDL